MPDSYLDSDAAHDAAAALQRFLADSLRPNVALVERDELTARATPGASFDEPPVGTAYARVTVRNDDEQFDDIDIDAHVRDWLHGENDRHGDTPDCVILYADHDPEHLARRKLVYYVELTY
jgi:hypothetical protein